MVIYKVKGLPSPGQPSDWHNLKLALFLKDWLPELRRE